MKQYFLLFVLLGIIFTSNAQTGGVGIGTTTPNANASLDLGANNKGFLPNRVALTGTNSPAPLSAHVAGMVVFNTATAGTTPNNVEPGLYLNDGAQWVPLHTSKGFFARSAGTLSFATGAFPVITDWSIIKSDLGASFSNGEYTVPAGMQGWYSISCGFRHNTGCSYNDQVFIQVNGASIAVGQTYLGVNGGTVNGAVPNIGPATASVHYYLNAGDKLRIVVTSSVYVCATGGNTTTTALPESTYFSILKH